MLLRLYHHGLTGVDPVPIIFTVITLLPLLFILWQFELARGRGQQADMSARGLWVLFGLWLALSTALWTGMVMLE